MILPVDKPPAWSSFDVVRALRRILGIRKIGHAGTLDPLATGLLICGTGRGTRELSTYADLDKEYVGVMRLGQETASFDSDTPVTYRCDASHVTDVDLDASRLTFVGDIIQHVPAYSAVKVKGERLYRKARRGEDFTPPPRAVRIDAFDLLDRQGDDVSFRIICSKGTYIRSVAHDLGRTLGVGAHLIALRRTRIGFVSIDSAWQIAELQDHPGIASIRAEVERRP
jgi:tRNA pseudouridine55 synthase